MENYYSDEELDLKLILLYVLKKWKPILLVSFVGLLLGSCLSLFRMQNNSPESILKRLNKLEESDINEYNIQLYSDYKKLYDAHVAYENDSALMKLDANNVYTGNLVYSISAENKDIDSVISFVLVLLFSLSLSSCSSFFIIISEVVALRFSIFF